MSYAAFILSTGRCGTQWIAATLAEHYGDRIRVTHEPLHQGYDARNALSGTGSAGSGEKDRHLDRIETRMADRPYLECGHPCWSSIPLLAERFQGRVRIIHLTRHPVPTCCSWLTHGAFQPPLAPHLPEKVLLSPFDPGMRFQEYRDMWDRLVPFEKCLYYWIEVNAFAMDWENSLGVPWLRLRFEDLFQGNGLARLLAFLDLPLNEAVAGRRSRVIDEHRFLSPGWQDWQTIHQHPRAVAVAEALGYDLQAVNADQLARRYLGGGHPPSDIS